MPVPVKKIFHIYSLATNVYMLTTFVIIRLNMDPSKRKGPKDKDSAKSNSANILNRFGHSAVEQQLLFRIIN
jgi:hypothetical protein